MKRFFCTVCKKIKRTQKWPILHDWNGTEIPTDVLKRTGECNYHSKPYAQNRQNRAEQNRAEQNKPIQNRTIQDR